MEGEGREMSRAEGDGGGWWKLEGMEVGREDMLD